ncbi:hypothetical protein AYX13_07089, partial [Cryptococcus neoformans]
AADDESDLSPPPTSLPGSAGPSPRVTRSVAKPANGRGSNVESDDDDLLQTEKAKPDQKGQEDQEKVLRSTKRKVENSIETPAKANKRLKTTQAEDEKVAKAPRKGNEKIKTLYPPGTLGMSFSTGLLRTC